MVIKSVCGNWSFSELEIRSNDLADLGNLAW